MRLGLPAPPSDSHHAVRSSRAAFFLIPGQQVTMILFFFSSIFSLLLHVGLQTPDEEYLTREKCLLAQAASLFDFMSLWILLNVL